MFLSETLVKRQIQSPDVKLESLISYEEFLRKSAYKNTVIKTDESFFNDSDMVSDYYLIIVYDQLSNTPLLSSRYYFNKFVIEKNLMGDTHSTAGYDGKLNLKDYSENSIFLADRLSGNTSSSIYRHYRDEIFKLFYAEILNHNKNCTLLLMVRKEKHEKLLNKYLKLGFKIVGLTTHKTKEHWILLNDLKK